MRHFPPWKCQNAFLPFFSFFFAFLAFCLPFSTTTSPRLPHSPENWEAAQLSCCRSDCHWVTWRQRDLPAQGEEEGWAKYDDDNDVDEAGVKICLLLGVVCAGGDAPRRQGIASIFGQAARPRLGTLSLSPCVCVCVCGVARVCWGRRDFFFFFLKSPANLLERAATTRDSLSLSWGGENDGDAQLPCPAVWHTPGAEKTKQNKSLFFFPEDF